MTLFLPSPGYGPRGPDGQGWNRLSLSAHFEDRNQCGLQPTNYPTLFESMTGRQRWGGFDRCSAPAPGRCGTCPVQHAHLREHGIDWPAATPLLLVRVRPLPPTPGALFSDPAAGRSTLEPCTWLGAAAGISADWATLRHTPGVRLGRSFRDSEGEAFWLVRNNPASSAAVVRTRQMGSHTRHALYGRSGGPRLALLTCHGGCAHRDDDLRHLAADLGSADDLGTGGEREDARHLPRRLPGAPGTEFAHEDRRTVLRRHGSTLRISWDERSAASALAAYAVRLTAS
ncbi:hypothetical protein [Streptomyces californicus]|uniref:hypothetical protein n=1 Tax=Streptomyces californicus TaxID=67351 RepID=UPI00371CD9BC